MKLIKPSVELITQESGFDGMLRHIEKAGRTCYKSEENITENSAKKFVDMIIKSGHTSVLEHGTVYLKIDIDWDEYYRGYTPYRMNIDTMLFNPNIKFNSIDSSIYLTMNYRSYHDLINEIDLQNHLSPQTKHHPKRYSFRIICDRGVGNELVRHRKMSFSQESTRYCNYSKRKFGNQLTFITPSWMDSEYDYESPCRPPEHDKEYKYYILCRGLEYSEEAYFELLKSGCQPQQARQVLPLALKTEIVITGFEKDWKHFLSLRSPKAGAKGVHPDMAVIADMIYNILETK